MSKKSITIKYRKRLIPLSIFLFFSISLSAQKKQIESIPGNALPAWYSKSFFGLHLRTSVLPKAKIEKLSGSYFLSPKPNISYSCGFRYTRNLKPELSLVSGIDLKFTKLNFYVYVPASDIPTIPRAFPNTPIVDYTEAHFQIAIPFLIERRFELDEKGFWAVRAGGNINYNGFNLDGRVGWSVTDINGQGVSIYSGDFEYTNGYKPWITFVAAAGKNLVLSNKNILGFELGIEAGKNGYVSGDYVITIPNKPASYGIYKINGFSAGLTVSYTFTGANKKLAKKYISK
ncbi:MAG: hypothetical protein K2X48_19985 [Chitinophagaceae bacterium]|nr:hypothetical protein [Chitinophagaceae bacterium]